MKNSFSFLLPFFQNENYLGLPFFFNSSVFEEISYSLTVSGKKENIKEITHNWMTNWGLNPELFENKYPFKLSGGEKRRVALAALRFSYIYYSKKDESAIHKSA